MYGHEKEIMFLLRKLDNKRGCRFSAVKSRPSSMPRFVREL